MRLSEIRAIRPQHAQLDIEDRLELVESALTHLDDLVLTLLPNQLLELVR
jgi:hypothetical protein